MIYDVYLRKATKSETFRWTSAIKQTSVFVRDNFLLSKAFFISITHDVCPLSKYTDYRGAFNFFSSISLKDMYEKLFPSIVD